MIFGQELSTMVMYEFVHKDFEMLSQLEWRVVAATGELKFRLLSEFRSCLAEKQTKSLREARICTLNLVKVIFRELFY